MSRRCRNGSVGLKVIALEAAEGDRDPVKIDRYSDELPGKPHVLARFDMSEVKVIMPKLGLTMTKGTITEWKKQEGKSVKKDEVIAVIETEKIVTDIVSKKDGILKKILYSVGDEIPIGETIAIIESEE